MWTADLTQIDRSQGASRYIVIFSNGTSKVAEAFTGSDILGQVRTRAKALAAQDTDDVKLPLGQVDLTDPVPATVPVDVQAQNAFVQDYQRLARVTATPLATMNADVAALKADLEKRYMAGYLNAL